MSTVGNRQFIVGYLHSRIDMDIDVTPVDFNFSSKPLLIGGKAKEYYGIRKAGADIDFVISANDYVQLAKKYPNNLKDLYGDLGVIIHGFEIWKTICQFDYAYLSEHAIDTKFYKIISLEKLLFLTALGMKKEKYKVDLQLIVNKIFEIQYKNFDASHDT